MNPKIQYNPNQNSNKSFCGYLQNDPKVFMERQKTQHRQYNIIGEEQSWRIDTT